MEPRTTTLTFKEWHMAGESLTQIGVVTLIAITVIKEAFAFAKFKKNGNNGQYVSEPLCIERTKRIEDKIESSNALTQEKLNTIGKDLKTRPCMRDGDCDK